MEPPMALLADGTPGQMDSNDVERIPTSAESVKGEISSSQCIRAMHRISSSPSLCGPTYLKSAGSPYRRRSTSSCVSLLATEFFPISNTNQSTLSRPSPLSMESTSISTNSDPASTPLPGGAPDDAPDLEDAFVDAKENLEDGEEQEGIQGEDQEGIEGESPSLQKACHQHPQTFSESMLLLGDIDEIQPSRQVSQEWSEPPSDATPFLDAIDCSCPEPLPKPRFHSFDSLPVEIRLRILSFLPPKALVRASMVSKSMYSLCFDGQLWVFIDTSAFYQRITAASLASIISSAGGFARHLNLRGCVQVEHYKRAETLVRSCKNLRSVTLEGCFNLQKKTLHGLLERNENLVHINLTGLTAVTNLTCTIIAKSCRNVESLNVSWCSRLDAIGLAEVVGACKKLKELYAGEVKGFGDIDVAMTLFRTNRLERLVLSGCTELDDDMFSIMMRGLAPELDLLTSLPRVAPRKLRYLDLSRCVRLTSYGVESIAHVAPYLEGLQLSRCKLISDSGIARILATTPRLTHLELEELERLTSSLLSEHLAKAPCARTLEHLGLSYCENVGDSGMLPVMKQCVGLKRVDLDNTRISDLVLAEAASMVMKRSTRSMDKDSRPKQALHLSIFDCPNVTWAGVREILFRNAQVRPCAKEREQMTYPTEMIGLKTFYGFQMTVNEHQKRVLRGDFAAAVRLERKWADYMQAAEEAGAEGMGFRRRRRRVREAQTLHLNEEGGGGGGGPAARPRARTLGSCSVM